MDTRDRRDEAVDRLRTALQRLVRDSGVTQRVVERRNGFARGYLSQVLQGRVTLTARHVFGILFALKMPPEAFFTQLFGDLEAAGATPLSEIHQRMARYDDALRELEDKGLLSPAAGRSTGRDPGHQGGR